MESDDLSAAVRGCVLLIFSVIDSSPASRGDGWPHAFRITIDHRLPWHAPQQIGMVTVGSPSDVKSVFFGDHLIVIAHCSDT
jgi:hypothetical protein